MSTKTKSKKATKSEGAEKKTAKVSTAKTSLDQKSEASEKQAPSISPAGSTGRASRPMLRAVKVDEALLAAVKAYKKEKGVSLYDLGYQAIKARLIKEGFMEEEPKT